MKKTICLNMIVRNEEEVIERCLASVRSIIDYWIISDTGSTDRTKEFIASSLQEIPGELHEHEWVDFSHNRNQVLELAKNKADYHLFIDADDELVFETNLPTLDQDVYLAAQKHADNQSLSYVVLLAKSTLNWRWHGELHESIQCVEAKNQKVLNQVYNLYHQDGHRSKDDQKFAKDANLLQKALKKDPNNPRTLFFLAETLRWANQPQAAFHAYRKRASIGGFPQEVYWSLYNMAKLQKPNCTAFCKAHQFRPSRIEPLYDLNNDLLQKGHFFLVFLISKYALSIPLSTDLLFVEPWIYEWGALLQYGIALHKLGKTEEAASILQKVSNKRQ